MKKIHPNNPLKHLTIALPGLGGVGGAHLEVLAQLGVGTFHLADPDFFETANFNRQLGASLATCGRSKTIVMAERAQAINPEVKTRCFNDGITTQNMASFLDQVDIVVDGLDYFQINIRRQLHQACRERNIPVVIAGPIGFGASVMVFTPQGLSFDEYFGMLTCKTRTEQLIGFGLGLNPSLSRDLDLKYVDPIAQKGPALVSSCNLCASLAATEVVKWVTGKGTIAEAGSGVYMDIFRGKTSTLFHRPWLYRGLVWRLIRTYFFQKFPDMKPVWRKEHDLWMRSQTAA